MTSLHPVNVDKPVENVHPSNLPNANKDHLAKGLSALVDHSARHSDVTQNIHAPMQTLEKLPWVHDLIPGIQKLAAEHHVGNFVVVRGTDQTFFESMPIYARFLSSSCLYFRRNSQPL